MNLCLVVLLVGLAGAFIRLGRLVMLFIRLAGLGLVVFLTRLGSSSVDRLGGLGRLVMLLVRLGSGYLRCGGLGLVMVFVRSGRRFLRLG